MFIRLAQTLVHKQTNISTSVCRQMSTDSTKPILLRKERYDYRSKKRKWEERRTDKGAAIFGMDKRTCQDNSEGNAEPFVRIKRKKYAMMMSYSGVDYYGMQRNDTMKTIEDDLANALFKADLIPEEAFRQMQFVNFQRSSRTDKGVSAARQIVSLKLPDQAEISKINEHLPPVIRVFGIKRVTKGFDSKKNCDARTYMYMLPTIAFHKPDPNDSHITQMSYRLPEERHNQINEFLKNYVGTKNYHNFTSKKKPLDPSCKRHMFSFVCESPIIRKGTEFVVLKVKGQSFMMHQIRKMVSLVIAIMRGYIDMDLFNKAFTTERVNITRAPGLGLVLEFVHFDRYDLRYSQDGVHESLTWEANETEVEQFKEDHIYPTIINTEVNETSMMTWITERLCNHDFTKFNEEDENNDGDEANNQEDGDDAAAGLEVEKVGNDVSDSTDVNSVVSQ